MINNQHWLFLIPILVWLIFMIACFIAWYYWFKGQNNQAEKIFSRSLLGFFLLSLMGWICFGLKYGVWFQDISSMSATRFLLFIGFLPILVVFWLVWWIYQKTWGKKQAQQTLKDKEFKQKWSEHLRNFDLSRLKNRTWQKSIGKYKKKSKNPKAKN